MANFGSDTKLDMAQCAGQICFQYRVIAPYLANNQLSLLGELTKIIVVSET